MRGRDWPQRIVELALVKQRMHELDLDGLWEYHLPGLAATEADLVAVEARLGEELDSGYRSFLRHAGGWPAFFQTVDLFGPSDLIGGPRHNRAQQMLGFIEADVLRESGFAREQLLPIAATPVDLDLFVMARSGSHAPGLIIWFAGAEVDRFPDFDAFYDAMVDYNRLEVQRFSERPT